MKKILAIVLSIAILVMAFPLSVFAVEPTVATDTWDGTTVEPTTTDADGNIIINTAEEMAWVALVGGDTTAGQTYKVADNQVFDMQGFEGITLNSTAAEIIAATKTEKYWTNTEPVFKGIFDGNGVVVYNVCGKPGVAYGGLFPHIKDVDVTIKNIVVKASAFYGYLQAGAIVGLANFQKTVNVEKCWVENCYVGDNGDTNTNAQRSAAAIVGGSGNCSVNVINCFAANNNISAGGFVGGFVGQSSAHSPSGITINNSISIGMSPLTISVCGTELGKDITERCVWENVYTDIICDKAGVTTLTTDKMQGEAAKSNMSLAWNIDWFAGADGEYPSINFGEPIRDPYVWDGSFKEPTETDDEGNIIINTVHEMAWVALRGGDATANKNYKVADGIKYFNMNGMSGITLDSTAEQVNAATKDKTYLWSNDSKFFMGNFDGNGLTVYNINGQGGASYGYAGLFTVVKPENDAKAITIKNVTVAASYFEGYHYTGGIVGIAQNQSANTGCINVDSCAVKNCYFYDTVRIHNSTSGLIIGQISHNSGNVSNCLAINNISDAANVNGGLVGSSTDFISTQTISNCVVIGSLPYSTVVEGSGGKVGTRIEGATVTNVYTDQASTKDGYTTLTTDNMQGAAAADNMNLNWGINWAVGAEGEYPSIITDNAFYDEWDGTFTEPTKTDAEGNIIINSAEELAWVALRGGDATIGKNYKVADGIKYFNMNGKAGITFNSSVTDVKAAENTGTVWSLANEKIDAAPFQGNFDGNGLTVYNIVTTKYSYSGLFPVVKPASGGSITVKNVAVVASDIRAYHNAGAVVGVANAPDTSTSFTLENCIVKNCFISDGADANPDSQRTAATHVGALSHNATTINNCLAINNELSAQGAVGGFFSNTSNYGGAINVSNSVSIGTNAAVTVLIDGSDKYGSKIAAAVYTNVYTDQSSNVSGVTTLTVDEMSGENALTNTKLDWSCWFATTGLPELRVFHNITSTDNEDGTHSNECADCDISGLNTPHTYKDRSCVVCGAECTHVENEPVEENRVDSTCMAEGSYDLVVYCSVCGEVVSRTTETIEINPDAHTFDNDTDVDCNNGCGFIRVNYGDSNGDGEIDNKDIAIIMQHINGWDVEINELSADVNRDNKINNKDYVILMQYINGWPVTIG